MTILIVAGAATLATGLLGGLNFGSMLARRGARALSGSTWVLMHQAEDAVFRYVMPPFLLATIALSTAAAMLSSRRSSWIYSASAVLILIDMLLSVSRLVPINRAIASWDSGALPVNWPQTRERWSRLHALRTGPVLLAALLSTIALAEATAG